MHNVNVSVVFSIGRVIVAFASSKNKTGNVDVNVTLRCVRVTIVAVEKH
jgi:hypothetical protein